MQVVNQGIQLRDNILSSKDNKVMKWNREKGDKQMNWTSDLVFLTNLTQYAGCRERDAGQKSNQK
jgi:hypothetical protein